MTNQIRIPNLPMGAIVDAEGKATSEELFFRQALLKLLESIAGAEGLVMPTQPNTNVPIIQNNQLTESSGVPAQYTCQYGTMIYDANDDKPIVHPLKDKVIVSVNNGSNAPVFKEVFLFDDYTLYPSAGAISGYALTTYNGTQYKIALYALS